MKKSQKEAQISALKKEIAQKRKYLVWAKVFSLTSRWTIRALGRKNDALKAQLKSLKEEPTED